jgi:hypothetical protein
MRLLAIAVEPNVELARPMGWTAKPQTCVLADYG